MRDVTRMITIKLRIHRTPPFSFHLSVQHVTQNLSGCLQPCQTTASTICSMVRTQPSPMSVHSAITGITTTHRTPVLDVTRMIITIPLIHPIPHRALVQTAPPVIVKMAWEPATFNHDAQYFPIYSGEHQGEWDQCNDCHTNPNDYSVFTCITCHANPETNEQHAGVNGYAYSSPLCLACHPTGNTEGMFNHNQTNFPLTGSHTSVDCLDCHSAGFEGTPTDCNACHTPDFNQAVNPNHLTLGLPTDCASCHTTAPNWNPASFGIHNQYYVLNGAHATIANQCVTCHNGDYNNTPSTCVGCHQDDYNQTNNPSHVSLNFSTDCASCHTESAWSPAEYSAHDQQFFPIYSGAHEGAWDQCNDCHTNANNYSIFTCITCHTSSETNQQHNGVNGYFYESSACLACHPTGDAEGAFNHNESDFPLTGAHTSVSCVECHANGYQNTPTECNACHTPDYNQASNPNHNSLGLSTDCVTCHTTAPNWNPALFPVHDDYYPLLGAHAAIENQCATCHNGNYNNTPNTCVWMSPG